MSRGIAGEELKRELIAWRARLDFDSCRLPRRSAAPRQRSFAIGCAKARRAK